jgi:uncharacterized protein (TIGR02600 family)
MKTTPIVVGNSVGHPSVRRGSRSGIAIITVLSVLLLMSVLVLAFFSLAANEYVSSKNYDYGVRSRQASDTAISMVIGQIRKATTQRASGKGFFAWASQPGAITSFKSESTSYQKYSEAAHTKYKLYSSDVMEAQGDYNCSEDVDSNWIEKLDIYCDLNAPIIKETNGDPTIYFPIVDPRAFSGTYSVAAGIDNRDGPDGFAITETTSAGNNIAGIEIASGSKDITARVPMPVRWMYMLEDGTMGTLTDKGKFLRSYGTGEPSEINPMSYRFAFWTDDETSKININTASEGTAWDVPAFAGAAERKYSELQPQENEFQRFPGHPATTSLSVALAPKNALNKDLLQGIYDAAPKVSWGGTEAGMKSGVPTAVDLEDDRLYATVDEYLFSENDRHKNNSLFTIAKKADLEKSKFLLTANSRAPELTLFGTPRMSMWGMQVGSTSPFDRFITRCSTVGGKAYFYRRSDSNSRHGDVYNNQNELLVLEYLKNHTELENPIPGFGGNFGRKYGNGTYQDRMQICTEMVDWIRNVNNKGLSTYSSQGQVASICLCGGSQDHTVRWPLVQAYPKGFGRMYTLSEAAIVFIKTATGPGSTNDGDPQKLFLKAGEQRIQASIAFEVFCPSLGQSGIMPNMSLQVVDGSKPRTPTSNSKNRTNYPELKITENIAPTSYPNPFQGLDAKPYMANSVARGNSSTAMKGRRSWGGTGGIRMCLSDSTSGVGKGISWTMDVAKASAPTSALPVGHIVLPAGTSSMTMEETKVRIILYDNANDQSVGNLIQVFDLVFPETTVPVPSVIDTWDKRIVAGANKEDGEDLLIKGKKNETVRSLSVSHGDFRLVSAKRVVAEKTVKGKKLTTFKPHPQYDDSSLTHVHTLTKADGSPVKGMDTAGKVLLLPNVPEEYALDIPMEPGSPDYAPFATAIGYPYTKHLSPLESGDFDNGLAYQPAGPYINRADDGTVVGGYFGDIEKLTSTVNRTPNRLVYGPGQFGSLSTGVQSDIPWRTLLFRPDPTHFGAAHSSLLAPGSMDPPDHLFMDLFWMPVVQPYPISEPFATSGKVNLNCQIAPFDYIKRQTAMHAILKGEKVLAIPDAVGSTYKNKNQSGADYRKDIDANQTLLQFEHRFKEGEIFRSASQICEIYLVPEGEKLGERTKSSNPMGDSVFDYNSMRTFWAKNRLTGDNNKERPYAGIYPRVTTKSNVYKVHMTVESLKKARSTDDDKWDVEKDRVTSQWRGSAVIERYIDPDEKNLPNYFEPNFKSKPNLEVYYNYRVLSVQQFSP